MQCWALWWRGGQVSLALVGASIVILIEKMAAAGPLGVHFRATP